MSSRKKANRIMPFITMLALLCAGIFMGALMANPQYRDAVFTKVNESKPIHYLNDYLAERKFELAVQLPTKQRHPSERK